MVRQHLYLLSRNEVQNLDEIIISERKKGYILCGLFERTELRPFVNESNNFQVTFIHNSNIETNKERG